MIQVYADMVADLFHTGHVKFLETASALGDYLIVGIHSNEDFIKYKRTPFLTMHERVSVVNACKFVDKVISPVLYYCN